ncbi:MAG: xanthine dehydrogenase family protein subunit M [Hyphomicrobiaceae bacterium]
MKSAPFEYVRPGSLDDAVAQLSQAGGIAVAVGGGQSLMPLLALRVAPADMLVDVGRLGELKAVEETADRVRLGAAVTHAMIEDGKVPDPSGGLMRRVATNIAYRAVRNHGTIGGSLALADPAADWPTVMLALDATLHISGAGGPRTERMDDFLQGAYSTALQPGEIVTGIEIPRLGGSARTAYVKVVRKSGAFANAIACVVVPGDGKAPRVVLGGTTARPYLLPAVSAHIAAQRDGDADTLSLRITEDLAAADVDADAYQRRLYQSTILRAVREAFA